MAITFTNQATLSYNGTQVLSNVAVGVLESPLSVTKTAVADEYSAGDTVTYAVSIINSSAAEITGLTVTDDLGTYDFNGETLVPLTYEDGSVLYFSSGVLLPDPAVSTDDGLTFSGITVPADGSVIIIYSATVNSYAPLAQGSAINNTVTVTGACLTTVEAQETITVDDAAQLAVFKSVSPAAVIENGELTYTFLIQNTGSTAVTDAVITDTFDPVLLGVGVTLDGAPLTAADYSYDEATGVFRTAEGIITVPAATAEQDPETGEWTVVPGSVTLTVTGTVCATSV